jgi:hypothetical protein
MKRFDWVRAASMAACAALATTAVGDLIVYEGFDCGAENNTRMDGLAGATSFGFDGGSAWTNRYTTGTNVVRTAGLTFGQSGAASLLKTIGGSTYGYANASWSGARLSRPLDVTATTIWGSYLLRREQGYSRWVHSLLLSPNAASDDGSADVDASTREFWGGGPAPIRLRGNQATGAGSGLSDNTTYLVLYKVTNLNASSGSSTATLWMLNDAQYLHHKQGGLTDAELNAAATGTGATQVMQRGTITNTAPGHNLPRFADSGFLILLSGVSDAGRVNAFFDELRISNASLDETVPLGPGVAVDNSMGGLPLSPTSAALRGTVVSPGDTSVDVYVFWGAADKGTDANAWADSVLVAAGLSGSAAVGTNLAHTVVGLARDVGIQYRYAVSNATDGIVWAPASAAATGSFSTQGYTKRMPIDFDGYTGTQVLTNFPALVRFTAAQVGSAANGVGYDVRFTDADGMPLNHEIESWNAGDGWNVWVQVPLLASSTRVWFHAGNSEVAGYPSYYARQGGAWTPEFKGVWHLGENVVNNQTAGVHADATANRLEALQRGNAPVAGIVGKAQRTEKANNEYLIVTNKLSAALDVGSQFTLSSWVRWEGAAPTSNSRMFARKNTFQDPNGFEIIQLYQAASPQHQFWVRGAGSSNPATYACTTVSAVSTTWWHMTVVFNGTAATLYRNGELVGSGTILAVANNDVEMYIGNFGALTGAFNGDFDEVRLEQPRRSADWIKAVLNNRAAPPTGSRPSGRTWPTTRASRPTVRSNRSAAR